MTVTATPTRNAAEKHSARSRRKEAFLEARLQALQQHDVALFTNNPELDAIIGVDEVGRGSLIGPIVAAGCLLTRCQLEKDLLPISWLGLDDSKAAHHTHASRLGLAEAIQLHSMSAITEATQSEVETLNVHHASLLAAQRAIEHCLKIARQKNPHLKTLLILLDGRHTLRTPFNPDDQHFCLSQQAIVKGDGQSAAIAAASILAKASRDSWVIEQAQSTPHADDYGWSRNMGYATAAHRRAIQTYGLTPLHRSTFVLKSTSPSLKHR